jgi:predicted phage tail component-like protein
MYIGLNFKYDGIDNDYYGVSLVRVSSGLTEFNFGVNRNIIEEKLKGKNPYDFGNDEEPISFTLTIAKIDQNDLKWSLENRKDISKWLFQEDYKPLIFEDNPEIVFYCRAIKGQRFDNCSKEGYIDIEMRCNAPYVYSNPTTIAYDLTNKSEQIITINNISNVDDFYFPEVEFELTGTTTGFSIINNTDKGREFKFTGLTPLEIVYTNNETRNIISSLESTDIYRYDNFNKNWLRLLCGENILKISGGCKVKVRNNFPLMI